MDRNEDLEAVVAAVYPSARRIALMLCRDPVEADDLTQDAILRAIRRPPKPLTEEVLRAWLRTTITRLFLSARRRLVREARSLARIGSREVSEVGLRSEAPSDELLAALATLSEKQRACVVLRYLEDLSEQDVARTLGIRHGTVKAHLAQARHRLRALLGDEVQDPVA